jgi:cytochrome c
MLSYSTIKTVSRTVAFLLIIIASTPVFAQNPESNASAGNTTAEVKSFVEKALAFTKTHDKSAALRLFTEPGGEFHQGGLYIFAYDFCGTVIAHGGNPSLVGKNLYNLKDSKGVPVISELIRLAKEGSGWLYYTWPNPEHEGREEAKLGYVVKVDDDCFIGSGTYGPAAIKP